jgi:electron transfer flavoprotein beta subunit
MNILVCMKQVPDPEGSQDDFEVNQAAGQIEPRGIPPVLSPFDESALELALRIKDMNSEEVAVSVLSMGRRISNAVMLKALAAGADKLVKVEDESLEAGLLGSFATANILAATIRKLPHDLIIVGRQAADFNDGQVGIGLAHILDLPVITLVRSVIIDGGNIKIERVLSNGHEMVSTPLPAVIVASDEVGELRYITRIQRRDAKQKPINVLGLSDIGVTVLPSARLMRKRIYAPKLKHRQCMICGGNNPAEAGRNLIIQLKEDRVI